MERQRPPSPAQWAAGKGSGWSQGWGEWGEGSWGSSPTAPEDTNGEEVKSGVGEPAGWRVDPEARRREFEWLGVRKDLSQARPYPYRTTRPVPT